MPAKDKAFWTAVWALDAASYAIVALVAYAMTKWLGSSPVHTGTALAVAGCVFVATRYGLWCLTRPYATEADAVVPAINRADLCNIDFKLAFVGLATVPTAGVSAGVSSSNSMIVYAAAAAICILVWVALFEPLKAANARDAASRNGAVE